MSEICLAADGGGKGGYAGGAGSEGQASQMAGGAGATGYGVPVIEVVTGMDCDLSLRLTRDTSGAIPCDLSGVASVELAARPTMRGGATGRDLHVPCTFTDDGRVSLHLSPKETSGNQGVWFAEVRCLDSEGRLVQSHRAYLCIRKGIDDRSSGPRAVTPMDVRLALMDTSPEANELLDDLEFSDALILEAVQRAVDEFEETPPMLARRFDATNFPWHEHLVKGAVGFLLQAVAHRYIRNRLQYSAAGMSMDSSDKGPAYLQLAASARSEWRAFIAAMKTSLNMDECFGVVSQPWFE